MGVVVSLFGGNPPQPVAETAATNVRALRPVEPASRETAPPKPRKPRAPALGPKPLRRFDEDASTAGRSFGSSGLSPKQFGLIAVIEKHFGMSDEQAHDWMRDLTGCVRRRDLTQSQFEELRRWATARGFRRPNGFGERVRRQKAKAARAANVAAGLPTVTDAQRGLIAALAVSADLTPAQQAGVCKRACGSVWPQTAEQAGKVIEALKALVARGAGADNEGTTGTTGRAA
jgi:hypothetical protein